MMQFTEFHLEASQDCTFDYLQIHDGPSSGSHLIGRFCGMTPPNGGTLNSTHDRVYLWFHSDSSVNGDGFKMTWLAVDPGLYFT